MDEIPLTPRLINLKLFAYPVALAMSFIVNTSPISKIDAVPQPIAVVEAAELATSSPVTKPVYTIVPVGLGEATIWMLINTAPKSHLLSPEKKEEVFQTLKCESGFDPKAKGDLVDGVATSIGTAQIHLPAHLDITIEQANDPVFSVYWTVEQFAAGNEKMWSCWKNIYQPKN